MDVVDRVYEELKFVIDPEFGLNIVDMGLVYDVHIQADKHVIVTMTFTTQNHPLQDTICKGVQFAVLTIEDIKAVTIKVVWSPTWNVRMMNNQWKELLIG
ncbi:metal-sulfur cluster assembly factor [Caldibacillus lycopersici]|uniref:Metal-sulfur cluster assembly factor n=1 Tax=Perspicuibacillus lycopersici TaxID=1325689 RepID=A0AAE3IU18_9BACI|nr:metal-sulfur cluster assembly factor [Perspicuibacillus lycopersici]MCU9613593.1 metal-sulfur cluster assembly factor [Perspicuibacillus lycopersici]